MTWHILRVVWSRRRHNGLIVVEFVLAFLLLSAILTVGAAYLLKWHQPLGFDRSNLWTICVDYGPFHQFDEARRLEVTEGMARLERELTEHPAVTHATLAGNVPYARSRWTTTRVLNGEPARVYTTLSRAAAFETFGYELVEGRWFERADETGNESIVVTEELARTYFPDRSAVGERLPPYDWQPGEPISDEDEQDRRTIIGVVRSLRIDGEHQAAVPHVFEAVDMTSPSRHTARWLVVRVLPGTSVAAEAELLDLAHRLQPEWAFSLERMDTLRDDIHREAFLPLLFLGVLAGFLVLMIALGLIGVLWQSVIRRTSEIGLRRALGATSPGTQRQILSELSALAFLAFLLGTVIYVQLPLVGIVTAGWPAVLLAMGASIALLYVLVIICGLYPSWLATRVEPATALTYE